MLLRWKIAISLFILIIIVILHEIWLWYQLDSFKTYDVHKIHERVTIRVNTFRRLDLIESFLDYYKECSAVQQIQVIWSDTVNSAPVDWERKYQPGKVVFEIHRNNSLTNRFKPLIDVPTEAVLSVDDDLIIPCEEIRQSLRVWQSNKWSLVGYTPRMHAHNIDTGISRYLRWQHSWWNGVYSIMLTKVAYMHRDYMTEYKNIIPKDMDDYIDTHRNCEDIAMAHVVAVKTQAAPVWVRGTVFEVSTGGISSNAGHFIDRSKCLDKLKELTHEWPWVVGYQKVLRLNFFDSIYMLDN